MNTSELIGKEVVDKSGNNVGKVVDIDINLPQWTVNHLTVRTGMIKKVPIGIDKIDKIGDKIILKTTKGELSKA
jgi:sporulation protein YlmC with PRC-barrel domain